MQLFKPKYETLSILEAIKECLESGWTGSGGKTTLAEQEWNKVTGFRTSLFLNSGTSALHVGLETFKKTYRWDDNSEIITTPLTFVSTNHAILYSGLKPVFADVDYSLNLDPQDVKRKITKNTKAIMFVGIGGNSQNFEEVRDIAYENNLKIFLDAAHMAGSTLNNKQVGVYDADFAAFSFHTVKNLPTADSGMLCFNDEKYEELARKLSWMGINKSTAERSNGGYSWEYSVDELGFKYNGNSIMAAIFLAQLPYLDDHNRWRRYLAARYDENLPSNFKKVPHLERKSLRSSRHLYQVIAYDRDVVIKTLREEGIQAGVHYKSNLEYPMFSGYCPLATELSKKIVSFPMHLGVTREDCKHICQILSQSH